MNGPARGQFVVIPFVSCMSDLIMVRLSGDLVAAGSTSQALGAGPSRVLNRLEVCRS